MPAPPRSWASSGSAMSAWAEVTKGAEEEHELGKHHQIAEDAQTERPSPPEPWRCVGPIPSCGSTGCCESTSRRKATIRSTGRAPWRTWPGRPRAPSPTGHGQCDAQPRSPCTTIGRRWTWQRPARPAPAVGRHCGDPAHDGTQAQRADEGPRRSIEDLSAPACPSAVRHELRPLDGLDAPIDGDQQENASSNRGRFPMSAGHDQATEGIAGPSWVFSHHPAAPKRQGDAHFHPKRFWPGRRR